MKFLNNVDMSKNELQNAVIQQLASAPSTPSQGQIYYNTTDDNLYVYDGSTWVDLTIQTTSGGDADTLGGETGSYYTNRANHTGTQAASTISNFDTQVRTNRLDQLSAPTASLSLNTQVITNLGTPSAATDAATKGYVDGVASGLDIKQSVRVATNVAGTLATSFENGDTVDGVTLATGDRILIKNQASGAENGIYIVNASGAPTRATDFDASAEVTAGAFVFVGEGTVNADTGWVLTTNDAITVGSTALTFSQFSGAGTYSAGAGLTLTGGVFAQDTASGYGVRKYTTDIGDNSTTAIVVTHSLNTRDVTVTVREAGSVYAVVVPDIEMTSVNTVTLRFSVAPTTNQFRVIITG
jgi:hypothetical protein